ncbi:MAG: hypothetical protein A4S15_12000 [Candidatus Raskinella chloraquaticus]|uniref:Uncharacterized protein n=1 Tax=Candidatus Raskinella chloraquaticus TaxID=1951219 RepID=A0A1W9HVM0_9HYPH|nr:MAG: hypothetical protein A4S15_12000 [Proteobacteria bacterium SG_bin8]
MLDTQASADHKSDDGAKHQRQFSRERSVEGYIFYSAKQMKHWKQAKFVLYNRVKWQIRAIQLIST